VQIVNSLPKFSAWLSELISRVDNMAGDCPRTRIELSHVVSNLRVFHRIGKIMKNSSRVVSPGKPSGRSTNHRGPHPGAHRTLTAAGVGTRPIVAVFGSSQPRRGDDLYKSSLMMGALLGRYGFDVMTGGYKGVMEAVSRGAHGNGAHVVGVTMARFEDRVNRYVMDEVRTGNFYERFRWLVDRADAYIAMGGGIGTLAEVTFTWQELQLGMVSKRPLVLVGPRWRALFKCFTEQLIPTPGIFDPMTLVDTPEQAAEFLCDSFRLTPTQPTRTANGRPIG
jgi:uncharacterized protein (TIGR00730 family)